MPGATTVARRDSPPVTGTVSPPVSTARPPVFGLIGQSPEAPARPDVPRVSHSRSFDDANPTTVRAGGSRLGVGTPVSSTRTPTATDRAGGRRSVPGHETTGQVTDS